MNTQLPRRQVCFDTETTGLDPKAGHRIVEIGCVELYDYVRTGAIFHYYINPERDMPPEAERVHGLSAAFLAAYQPFPNIADAFLEFVADAPLVAHNASFDMKFINAELSRAGYTPFANDRAIDTLQLARRQYPGQQASLDALCRRFRVDLSARDKHGALLDAELLADVYLELRGGRQVGLGLPGIGTGRPQACKQAETARAISEFPDRTFDANDEERIAHQAFVKQQLGDGAIWNLYDD